MVMVGNAFTVTVTKAVSLHPFTFTPVTHTVLSCGSRPFTVNAAPSNPSVHVKVDTVVLDAVNVITSVKQMEKALSGISLVILITGNVSTMAVTVSLNEQLLASVTTT